MTTLTSIKGIGSWTAKMFLIFAFRRDDVLPYEDNAFMQAFKWLYETPEPSRSFVLERGKLWCPYSSIAARYLYQALDMHLIKTDMNLIKKQGAM